MLNLTSLMKISVLSGVIALGGTIAMMQPAAADDDGGWGVYCGDSGYYCNDHYRDYNFGDRYYRGPYGYYRYGGPRYGDWDSWDNDGYHRWHTVCDSGGDRCYRSPTYDWDYREYYRLHGYHWGD